MENIEVKLWDYIDGILNDDEKHLIKDLIDEDDIVREKYLEICSFNSSINSHIEFEEPSMGFTYTLLNKLEVLNSPLSNKVKVNTKIIYGIASFFLVSLLCLLGYILFHLNVTHTNTVSNLQTALHLNFSFFKTQGLQIFIVVDIVLLLLWIDRAFHLKTHQ